MTDFLTSIANRNFSVSATIRPRLVSLFEPPRAPAALLEMESETLREGPSIERERPVDSQQHDDGHIRTTGEVKHAATPLKIAYASRDPLRSLNDLSSNKFSLNKDESVGRGLQVNEVIQQREHVSAEIHQPAETSDPTIPERQATPVTRSIPESLLVRHDVIVPSNPTERLKSPEPARHRPLLPPQMPENLAIELRHSVAEEKTQRLRSSPAVLERRTLRTEAEPDVHVTIGRIEVRATLEGAPSRSSRAASAMGLDEYLRRRSQRGGR